MPSGRKVRFERVDDMSEKLDSLLEQLSEFAWTMSAGIDKLRPLVMDYPDSWRLLSALNDAKAARQEALYLMKYWDEDDGIEDGLEREEAGGDG